jgi:hypothetical protein
MQSLFYVQGDGIIPYILYVKSEKAFQTKKEKEKFSILFPFFKEINEK